MWRTSTGQTPPKRHPPTSSRNSGHFQQPELDRVVWEKQWKEYEAQKQAFVKASWTEYHQRKEMETTGRWKDYHDSKRESSARLGERNITGSRYPNAIPNALGGPPTRLFPVASRTPRPATPIPTVPSWTEPSQQTDDNPPPFIPATSPIDKTSSTLPRTPYSSSGTEGRPKPSRRSTLPENRGPPQPTASSSTLPGPSRSHSSTGPSAAPRSSTSRTRGPRGSSSMDRDPPSRSSTNQFPSTERVLHADLEARRTSDTRETAESDEKRRRLDREAIERERLARAKHEADRNRKAASAAAAAAAEKRRSEAAAAKARAVEEFEERQRQADLLRAQAVQESKRRMEELLAAEKRDEEEQEARRGEQQRQERRRREWERVQRERGSKRDREQHAVRSAWDVYEEGWKELQESRTPPRGMMTFMNIPWPVIGAVKNGPEGLTPERMRAFLLAKECEPQKATKQRIRDAMLRFHPDRFEGRWMHRVQESDQELVKDGVGRVVRFLNDITRTLA